MTTEQVEQAAHARLFKVAGDRLAIQAGQMTRLAESPRLDFYDVARLYLATGANVLLHELGRDASAAFLREFADLIERQPRETVN
jgi:hypothetical protein